MASLDPTEYARRSEFNEYMKTMDKNSFVEVARILKKHNVTFSENRSGIFFDLVTIPQETFEDLIQFRKFIETNAKELEKRDIQK